MRLHQRGVDLLVNLMDADEHFDALSRDELRRLISEAIVVFGELLKRKIPEDPPATERFQRPSRLI